MNVQSLHVLYQNIKQRMYKIYINAFMWLNSLIAINGSLSKSEFRIKTDGY